MLMKMVVLLTLVKMPKCGEHSLPVYLQWTPSQQPLMLMCQQESRKWSQTISNSRRLWVTPQRSPVTGSLLTKHPHSVRSARQSSQRWKKPRKKKAFPRQSCSAPTSVSRTTGTMTPASGRTPLTMIGCGPILKDKSKGRLKRSRKVQNHPRRRIKRGLRNLSLLLRKWRKRKRVSKQALKKTNLSLFQ